MGNHSGTRPRIGTALVLEDDDATASALGEILGEAGYQVHLTATVAAASETLAKERVDLVLVDLGLEEGFGVDLLLDLAERPEAPAVILVSGLDLASIVAHRFGVPLVSKPFAVDGLLQTIDLARRIASRPKRARTV
jgi:DNA-binding response OmpR family regulator